MEELKGTTDNAAGSTGAGGSGDSGPAAGAKPVGRPKSAMAALDKAAAAPSSGAPTSTVEPGKASAGATDQSGAPAGDKGQGPIPFDRHQIALNNLRTELEGKFNEKFKQLEWAGEYDPAQVRYIFRLFENLHRDPRGFTAKIMQELKSMGDEPDEEFPEADLKGKNAEGAEIRAYSDAGLKKLLDVYGRRMMRQIFGDERMQSVFKLDERQQILERNAQIRQGVADETRTAMAEIQKAAHYEEVSDEIANRLEAMKSTDEGRATLQRVGPVAAMWMLYSQVVKDKILPGYESRAEKKVREEYSRKAASSGDVHPSHATDTGNQKRPRGVAALAKHMEQLAEKPEFQIR